MAGGERGLSKKKCQAALDWGGRAESQYPWLGGRL